MTFKKVNVASASLKEDDMWEKQENHLSLIDSDILE